MSHKGMGLEVQKQFASQLGKPTSYIQTGTPEQLNRHIGSFEDCNSGKPI